jgi:hypothetical protein
MYDIPFSRPFLQLSNGIRHVMPSTDPKPEITAKASMAKPVSHPAVYANGLKGRHFETVEEIHCAVPRELNYISKTAFLEGMKKLKERANKCIDQGGMYFVE